MKGKSAPDRQVYPFLYGRNDWLFEQLKIKGMSELARELAEKYGLEDRIINIAACIRYIVYRDFTDEQRLQIRKQRRFHKNRKSI